MNLFRLLLLPFNLFYGIVTIIRNKLYDWHIFSSNFFEKPIISVGNLEVGGSGKTPMVAYIINLLKDDFKVTALSRGYGRKTKGFLWVKATDEALNTGDEPLQLKQNFPDVEVAVCEDRAAGIRHIEEQSDVILMDDAYQHRAVKPGLNILLFDYNRLFKNKFLMPAGNYREIFKGRKRADIIIVSKAPSDLSPQEREKAINQIRKYPHQQLYFSSIKYSTRLNHIFINKSITINEINEHTAVLLITGIARPELILAELKKYTRNIKHLNYSDHHHFSRKNMLKLVADFNNIKATEKIIITTQKDAVRLRSLETIEQINSLPIYEWPIEVSFKPQDKVNLSREILNYVKNNKRIS